jgi:hypothetical protein
MQNVLTLSTASRVIPVKPRLTFAAVKAELATIGVKIRKTDCGEFRVVLAGQGEESAYYTDDLSDALGTGKEAAAWQEKQNNRAKIAAAVAEIESKPEPEKRVYRLGSTPAIYAPGIVRFARAHDASGNDNRQQAIKIIADGWNVPFEHAALLVSGTAGRVDGETFVFEV